MTLYEGNTEKTGKFQASCFCLANGRIYIHLVLLIQSFIQSVFLNTFVTKRPKTVACKYTINNDTKNNMKRYLIWIISNENYWHKNWGRTSSPINLLSFVCCLSGEIILINNLRWSIRRIRVMLCYWLMNFCIYQNSLKTKQNKTISYGLQLYEVQSLTNFKQVDSSLSDTDLFYSKILAGTTIFDKSKPENNSNEKVTPHSSKLLKISQRMLFILISGTALKKFFTHLLRMQPAYSYPRRQNKLFMAKIWIVDNYTVLFLSHFLEFYYNQKWFNIIIWSSPASK